MMKITFKYQCWQNVSYLNIFFVKWNAKDIYDLFKEEHRFQAFHDNDNHSNNTNKNCIAQKNGEKRKNN